MSITIFVWVKRLHMILLHYIYTNWLFTSDTWTIIVTHFIALLLLWIASLTATIGHRIYVHQDNEENLQLSSLLLSFIWFYLDLVHVPGSQAFIAQHDYAQKKQSCCSSSNSSDIYRWWKKMFLQTDCNDWATICVQLRQFLCIFSLLGMLYLLNLQCLAMPLLVITPLAWSYLWSHFHESAHRPSKFYYQNYTATNYEKQAFNGPKLLQAFSWGEMLHNNHHHNARAINFAQKDGEIDPAYVIIRLLEKIDFVRKSKVK